MVPGRTARARIANVLARLLRDGYIVLAIVFVGLRLFAIPPWADSVDAYAYWTTRTGDFYATAETGRIGAYLYSPAFAQIMTPLVALPLAVFTALWTAVNLAALWWLVGRLALPLLLFLPIPLEIISGNIHLLYAVAIVLGFRYPATWALMLLTKITPGIGVLWFAVRREWRAFAIAVGVAAVIAAVSFLLDRSAWEQWITLLRADLGRAGQGTLDTVGWYLPVALLPRLIVAGVLVVIAAWRNLRWLLPIAVVLALPVIWLNSLAVLVAMIPLWRQRTSPVASPEPAAELVGVAPS
jgi:glycosyl transferase family 87